MTKAKPPPTVRGIMTNADLALVADYRHQMRYGIHYVDDANLARAERLHNLLSIADSGACDHHVMESLVKRLREIEGYIPVDG